MQLARTVCAVLAALVPVLCGAQSEAESFNYTVEWRLVEAGRAVLNWTPTKIDNAAGHQADLHLESVGLVSRLYKVDDDYRAMLDANVCAASVYMRANEGKRKRETKITFDRTKARIAYLERDLVANKIVKQSEIDAAKCTHDVVGALFKLRALKPEPGQTVKLPISDGKKFVQADVEAQERETIEVPAGKFKTIRYEAQLFNGKLYARKARLFVWISDDEKRVPVQIRVRMGLAVGTITFQLAKPTAPAK